MPASPHVSENFGDLLDPRFQEIFWEEFDQLPDMVPTVYNMVGTNGREDMRWSDVGALTDFGQFTGLVEYDAFAQGFDMTLTPIEFAKGIQVERKLFNDDQFNIIEDRPLGLAQSANRTRQKHAARIYNNAGSVDNYFFQHTEGVALVSDSHPTNNDQASTASGFDNLATSALSATALASARIQFVDFRDDAGNRISTMPDEIVIPPALYENAYEIVASMGKLETSNNNRNVHEGAYDIMEWNYLTDSNNWFLQDSAARSRNLYWSDRIPLEFAFAEDLDTILAKWRAYMRYGAGRRGWRWILGSLVS